MSHKQLYADVIELLGTETVEAALCERAGLVEIDDALVRAIDAAARAVPRMNLDERHAYCAALDERTRRVFALMLLDRSFVAAIARAIMRRS